MSPHDRPCTPSDMVEALWAMFADEGPQGCPCGCTWDGRLWMHRDRPDEEMYDHIGMDEVDPQPVTRLENHWRHYQRWGHDGLNPWGGRAVALPTWKGRRETSDPAEMRARLRASKLNET